MTGGRLTEPELRHAMTSVSYLRVHASMHMGLMDPQPAGPRPMGQDAAAWVRDHAWTQGLRDIEQAYPWGFHQWCACERGTCWNCFNGRCEWCLDRQRGGPLVDTVLATVTAQHGYVVALVVHTDDQVPCRHVCACPCPTTGPAQEVPRKRERAAAPVPDPGPARLDDAPALFDLAEVAR